MSVAYPGNIYLLPWSRPLRKNDNVRYNFIPPIFGPYTLLLLEASRVKLSLRSYNLDLLSPILVSCITTYYIP